MAGALLLVCLYGAFDHGAVGAAGQERISLALAAVAAAGTAVWIWKGAMVLRAPALVWTGVALLAAFAVWSAITLTWSVAPDQTWTEANRAIAYLLVLVLAIAVGASHRRAAEIVAGGFLAVALAVTAYALAQKILPGLRVGGVIDLNQTSVLTRLQQPLGYWNALALFIAMGVPAALSLAADPRRRPGLRIAAAAAASLMLVTIAFTYSRGGFLALICGLTVGIGLSGARLRSLAWLALICAATVPAAAIGLISHDLTAAAVPLGSRELAGLELAGVLAACELLLVLAGRRLIVLERRARLSRRGARRIGRALLIAVAGALAIAVLAVTLSSRGLPGTASHAWKSFTATRATAVSDPGRLLSADSENRWVWWKEAAGAFSDRPVQGWGAGSFGVVHLLYRRDRLSVQQPHSVPLQFLAETGLVGALAGLGGLAVLLCAAVAAVRRTEAVGARLMAASLLAGAVAYAVHALYDWDWDIPAVTLPALIFLGTLGGGLARRSPLPGATEAPPPAAPGHGRKSVPLTRAAGVLLAWLCLASFVVSVVVPRVAATQASDALVAASRPGDRDLRAAMASALDASGLDPVSDAGLKAASTIAVHLGQSAEARRLTLEAIGRQPTDIETWQQLAFEDLAIGADGEALAAAQRLQALDPVGADALAITRSALLGLAPAQRSATAASTATP